MYFDMFEKIYVFFWVKEDYLEVEWYYIRYFGNDL